MLGFMLFSGAVIMLLLPLQWGGVNYTWNSSVIIGLFCGSGVTMIVFMTWEWHQQDQALIPPKIFLQRTMILAFVQAMCANGGFQTITYYLPIWFQAVLGATPTQSGAMYLPTVVSDVLTSLIGGGLGIGPSTSLLKFDELTHDDSNENWLLQSISPIWRSDSSHRLRATHYVANNYRREPVDWLPNIMRCRLLVSCEYGVFQPRSQT